ncbi:MAG: hypothetical protein IKI46_09760 [Lachnospiraceae bacterium]|nr:hypothetical protein [Lachnospiraceae bacterium]
MKKKALAIISAAMLMMLNAITVFAASPAVGTAQPPVATQTAITAVADTATPAQYAIITATSEGFKVSAVSDSTAKAAAVAVQNSILRDVATLGYFLGSPELVTAATTQGSVVAANILSTVDVDPTTAVKDANGMYNLVMSNGQIAAGDTIAILHYNGTTWELIKPVAVSQGSVAFQVSSLSPISIVKISANAPAASPKTGVTYSFMALVVLAAMAGAVICFRKYRRA